MAIPKAATPWWDLRTDLDWLFAGVLAMAVCYAVDFRAMHADWFARSGAVAVLCGGVVAYQSLSKHYQKFLNAWLRGGPLRTSRNQRIVDRAALALSIGGTLVWAYGDKIVPTP